MDKTYICIHLAMHLITGSGDDDHKVPTTLREQFWPEMWMEKGSKQVCHMGDVLEQETCALRLFPLSDLQASRHRSTFMAKVICN